MAPGSLHTHADFLELFALRRCEDFLNFAIGGVELAPHLGLNAGDHRIDARMVSIDDPLHFALLLGREMELIVEALDDSAGRELGRPLRWKETTPMEEIKAIAGDAGQQPADEHRHHHQGGSGAGFTR